MRILFRISHCIAKQGCPFSDYVWSADLHKVTHAISLGKTYRNDKACRTLFGFIAETEQLALDLKKAPFYSTLRDGSTDSSVCEAEIMYVRYSNHGKISNKFLALRNVDRADTENVTTLIETTLKEYGGFTDANVYKKLVGFGADGASVNMGCHNGIGARLQRNQPLLTSVHCKVHRLELAFKKVIQGNEAQFKVLGEHIQVPPQQLPEPKHAETVFFSFWHHSYTHTIRGYKMDTSYTHCPHQLLENVSITGTAFWRGTVKYVYE